MQRLHLFEFEDLPWFPNIFREYITELLQYQLTKFSVYTPIIPKLKNVLETNYLNKIFDVCSGSSGPILSIFHTFDNQKNFDLEITLTDKYPNLDAFQYIHKQSQGKINFISESVDALHFPKNLKGVRTFFSCFHHFQPQEARKIIQATIRDGMPICIFEFTERNIINFLKVTLFGFLLVWLNTPFLRPFKFSRLFWTYLIPVVPLTYCWDALVSHIRTYTTREMQEMLNQIPESQEYIWDLGKIYSPQSGFNLTYLIGYKNH
jgi:hypothetical protein